MRWNSLAFRLLASSAALVLAVIVVLTVFANYRAESALDEVLSSHGKMLLGAMESHAADSLILHDSVTLRNYVSEITAKEPVLLFAMVANAEGTIVAHSDHSMEGKKFEHAGKSPGENTGVSERETKYKDTLIFELTSPVTAAGKRIGTIQLGINHKGVAAALNKLALSVGLAGVVLLIVAVLGARMFTVKITSGLTRLGETTREISRGELRTKAPEEGYEEIRSLGKDFNTMAESLRTIIQQIQETGKTVGDFSSDVLNVIQDQATSSAQQAASVSEVTATMEELSRTSRQIADNAESVKDSAAQTVEMAQQGTVLIREGVGAMEKIKERVGDIAQRNLFLGEKSREIGKVMDIIKEIASEIHLLALNAAIESAAAGEHGRRFSVVASEVRRLAEKTRESTETIRSIISEIQSATSSSIQATDQGTREVDRWRETVNLSSDAFKEIIQMIEKTLEASTQISLATHQQTSANEQVVQAMRQIAEMVRTTATHMRGSSSSAGELKEMVARLRERAQVFRV